MPINWLEWSEQAFRCAREEDKPVFLFLEAAWCSSCRRFDREFLSLPQVSEIANRDYVPVRIDGDRRPDVNERYNAGGWPSIAFLTPAGSILWASAAGDPDPVRSMLTQIRAAYRSHRAKLEEEIRKRDEKVEVSRREIYGMRCRLSSEIFRKTVRGVLVSADPAHGGFGREPKFPMAPSLHVLLSAYREAGGIDLREGLLSALRAVDRGLFDGMEGGFFRFCLGEAWDNPQTEKMCEENAALIRVYLEAASIFGEKGFRERAHRAAEWAWQTLCDRDAFRIGASQAASPEYYDGGRKTSPPAVDRTQITSAAAQMCSAFLRAGAQLGRRDLAEFAARCLEEIMRKGFDPARGVAHYFDPEPRAHGLARSQAYLSRALVDAYEFTGRDVFLEHAGHVLDFCREVLWSDEEHGILDRIPGQGEIGELRSRRKNIGENALIADSAGRLARITGEDSHAGFGSKALTGFPEFLDDYGHYTADYALAADFFVRPVYALELPAVDSWVEAVLTGALPRRVIRHRPGSTVARVLRDTKEVAQSRSPSDLRGTLLDLP